MMFYYFDEYGRFAGTGASKTDRSTGVAPPEESPDYNWTGATWVFAPGVQPVPVFSEEPESIPAGPSQVSPIEFKLLFTATERVAIKQARADDPIVDDFFDIVEDPRLTHVNLGLKSTQDALDYLVAKELLAPERKDEILAGVLK